MSGINPKDLAARERVPMHTLPAAGAIHGAQATGNGVVKYGLYNWREKPISLMEYIGAMERHIACLKDGEDLASDSMVHHLGHINATTAIILDAKECGTLIDDRPKRPGRASALLAEYTDRCRAREQQTTSSACAPSMQPAFIGSLRRNPSLKPLGGLKIPRLRVVKVQIDKVETLKPPAKKSAAKRRKSKRSARGG